MRGPLSPGRIAAAIEAASRCNNCDGELEHTVWRVRLRGANGGVPWRYFCGICAPARVDWAPAEPCACCSRMVRQPRDTPPSGFTSCSPACYAAARMVRARVVHPTKTCLGCFIEFVPRRADQDFHSRACCVATWKLQRKLKQNGCPRCGGPWLREPADPDFVRCPNGHSFASAAHLHSLESNGSGSSNTNGWGASQPLERSYQ
jgi:hypothetical protein